MSWCCGCFVYARIQHYEKIVYGKYDNALMKFLVRHTIHDPLAAHRTKSTPAFYSVCMHMLAQPWGIAYAVGSMIVYADVGGEIAGSLFAPRVTLIGQILLLIACIMMLVLIMNLRQAFRTKYGIVAGRDGCGSNEDFWCMPCTLSQMHRHTDITHQLQPAGCNCSSPV
jgi:hypothetical protein